MPKTVGFLFLLGCVASGLLPGELSAEKRTVTPIPPVSELIESIRNSSSSGHTSTSAEQTQVASGVRSDLPEASTHVREVWKIKAAFALATLESGAGGGSVSRGFLDVLDSPEACIGDVGHGTDAFPKLLEDACPWGRLIRLRQTGDSKTEGKCYCTTQSNINAQDKILMNENGVEVSEPGHGETEPLPEPEPSHTEDSASSQGEGGHGLDAAVEERRKITAPFSLATLETIQNAGGVSRGYLEVLKSPDACSQNAGHGTSSFPQTKAGACPWGVLVRLKNTGDAKTEGKCFCTDQGNVNAQPKVLMEDNGVEVTEPGAAEASSESADYMEKFLQALRDNSCNKHLENRLGMPQKDDPYTRGKPNASARKRIKRCLDRIADKSDRMSSMCNCSTLRCAQMVKKSLFDAGLVGPEILEPMNANDPNIPKILSNNGFVKCTGSAASNPRNAPQGAVLIYHARVSKTSGDPGAPYGHIEVRTPEGYTSDFSISVPRTDYGKMVYVNGRMVRNRYLKHMYVKAPVKCP